MVCSAFILFDDTLQVECSPSMNFPIYMLFLCTADPTTILSFQDFAYEKVELRIEKFLLFCDKANFSPNTSTFMVSLA